MLEGLQIYAPTESVGQSIMYKKGMTIDKLSEALSIFQLSNYELKTLLGIDEKGFYGSHTEDWEEAEFVTFIPWIQIYELLGKVQPGSTEEFMEGGGEFN